MIIPVSFLSGVTIKNGVCVWEGITLEDYVFAGPNVVFVNDRFPRSPRNPVVKDVYASKGWLSRTLVREGATLGANATILCGITVGRYAMVGAGALVLRDVPDFQLVAGSPAKAMGHVCMCGHRPIFVENRAQVFESWQKLKDHGAKMIYPSHGDPFKVDDLVLPAAE